MSATCARIQPILLSILRIVTAYLFLLHGTAKFFGFPTAPGSGAPPGPARRAWGAVEADRGSVAQRPGAGEIEQAQRTSRLPDLQKRHIAARVDDSGVGEDLCRAGEQVAGGVQDSAVGVLACRKRVRIPAASRVWPPGPHLAPRPGPAPAISLSTGRSLMR